MDPQSEWKDCPADEPSLFKTSASAKITIVDSKNIFKSLIWPKKSLTFVRAMVLALVT
jgi:hypothetical protein